MTPRCHYLDAIDRCVKTGERRTTDSVDVWRTAPDLPVFGVRVGLQSGRRTRIAAGGALGRWELSSHLPSLVRVTESSFWAGVHSVDTCPNWCYQGVTSATQSEAWPEPRRKPCPENPKNLYKSERNRPVYFFVGIPPFRRHITACGARCPQISDLPCLAGFSVLLLFGCCVLDALWFSVWLLCSAVGVSWVFWLVLAALWRPWSVVSWFSDWFSAGLLLVVLVLAASGFWSSLLGSGLDSAFVSLWCWWLAVFALSGWFSVLLLVWRPWYGCSSVAL